ncbi:MAG: DUF362 domain-containing protein [Chloroflexota bacterium]
MYPKPKTLIAHPSISRRDFLRLTGLVAASLVASSCQPKPTPSPTSAPVATQTPSPSKTPVAISRVQTYDRATIEKQLAILIDQLGGLGDVVKPGDSVAIKPNLTGGVYSGLLKGYTAVESFITHPEVVRALVKQVQAAGAKEIFIVEAVYEWESYTQWGYEEIANDLGVKLINLNDSKPYADFIETPVGPNSYIYEKFTFNPILKDVDVFMSVSKMKNHYLAGVTHTMKNLYGLVPYRFYTINSADKYRSGFHGTETQTRQRLPRIIVDINRARPINFSLIDGIKTSMGGEGPWIESMAAIAPGVMIAGKNPVATDAVATAVMGHDPLGKNPNSPFVRCDNHIQLAADAGLGTNRLDEIEVLGEAISQVQTKFVQAP